MTYNFKAPVSEEMRENIKNEMEELGFRDNRDFFMFLWEKYKNPDESERNEQSNEEQLESLEEKVDNLENTIQQFSHTIGEFQQKMLRG